MWAIVGGSGFEKFEGVTKVLNLDRHTPFGEASTGFKKIKIGEQECLFLPRHGENHELSPSEVNYRANIFALKRAGALGVLSISAVGSLRAEFKPGDLVVPSQYIDRTKSHRAVSFCGDGLVGHVSLAHPVHKNLLKWVEDVTQADRPDRTDCQVHLRKTYVCIEGPYFSTQAESLSYIRMGADIIGMTNFPEFALAREAGLGYLPLSYVTDYDCWDDAIPHATLPEILKIMKENNQKAFQLVEKLTNVPSDFWTTLNLSEGSLQNGLMTPPERIRPDQKEWLNILFA